jgi:6-phosphofructokinase 2
MPAIATLTMNPALDVTTRVAKVMPTHKLRCGEPRFDPGGGGINVARVIHTLGGDVTAVFPPGGPAGATIEQLLRAAGVPIASLAIAGATRESLTVEETDTGCQYRFVLPGPALGEDERRQLFEALANLPRKPGYVVASGSLPPECDPSLYARLAAHCRQIGARLIVDTSGPALAACEGAQLYLI